MEDFQIKLHHRKKDSLKWNLLIVQQLRWPSQMNYGISLNKKVYSYSSGVKSVPDEISSSSQPYTNGSADKLCSQV